jgi:hypothetical protein
MHHRHRRRGRHRHRRVFLGVHFGRRLRDRRGAFGRRRLHRHEHLGALERAHRAAAQVGLQAGLTMAFRAGAITGMLVAGLALLAIAVFFWYLTGPAMLHGGRR